MGITAALHPVGSDGFYSSQIQLHPAWLWLAQPMTTVAPASPPGLPPASSPAPLSTEPTATVSARGAPMLPSDMESVTELPSPPPLRTATMSTDMSWPPVTPSARLTLVLPDLSSRGLSSTPATARGPLMPMLPTAPLPLLRTATTSTATSTLPSTPSASPTPASADLTSRSLVSTPASTTVATTARGPLSPSTEVWLSTLDILCLLLTGLFRVSALDTATAMGSMATARGPLSLSTEEWLSTLDTLCLPLTGLLRDSALDTATDTGTATARGPLSLSMGQQSQLRTTTTSMDTSLALVIPSASLIPATLALPSMSPGFTPTFSCLTAQASATK